MNPEYFDTIFRCPKCKSGLKWEEKKCSGCGRPFQVDDGIFDFILDRPMEKQHRAEIELHQSLAQEYPKRYQENFSKVYSDYWNQQFVSHLTGNCETILDCGCGTGDLIRGVLPYGKRIIGMDISKAMLRQVRMTTEDRKKVIRVAGPGESFPFAGDIFDVVCFRGSLHHMANEVLALREAHRTLKAGGTLMISEPNDDSLVLRLPRKLVNKYMARFGNDHKAFRSKSWLKTIRQAGFSITSTKNFSFLSQPLCGMSDLLPLMKMLPYSTPIARLLVRFDEFCSHLPFIREQSFDLFVVAHKN